LAALAALPAVGLFRVQGSAMTVDEFGGRVDIGGRALYVESRGMGGPTVVFEAGYLGRSDVWSRDLKEPVGERTMVIPGVIPFARTFTYDRPGTIGEVNSALDPTGPEFLPSRSDPVPQPRTIRDVVDDLHTVLGVCDVPGPYVLVGHSLGGLSMRLYASTYPEDVVGLVLVDATSEYTYPEFKKALSPQDWARFDAMQTDHAALLDVYPEAEILFTAPEDEAETYTQMIEAEKASPLRPMPLVVLSHGIPFAKPFPDWPTETMEGIMTDLQVRQANLVPNGRHVVADRSGHNIHQDQPDLVIAAVQQVVEAVRDPSTWPIEATPAATPHARASDEILTDTGSQPHLPEFRGGRAIDVLVGRSSCAGPVSTKCT